MSELLPVQPAATAGVRLAGEELQLWSGPRGGAGRLLVRRGPLELWSWTFEPDERHESAGHRPGCIELISVTAGTLHLEVGDDSVTLSVGDNAWFEGTEAHAYRNPTDSATHFTLAVFEP